jgi:hypothetical protein
MMQTPLPFLYPSSQLTATTGHTRPRRIEGDHQMDDQEQERAKAPEHRARIDYPAEDLAKIRERVRQGKLTHEDLRTIEQLIMSVERASKALRAAMVE